MRCGRRTTFLKYLLLLAGFWVPLVAGTGQAFGPCTGDATFNLAATVDYHYILSDNFYGDRDSTMVLTEEEIRAEFGSSFNFGPQRNTYDSNCKFVVTAPADYYVKIEIIVLGGPTSRRGGCLNNYIIIKGTSDFGDTTEVCATSDFRDTRSLIPAGEVNGELIVGNDNTMSCSTASGQSVEITASSSDGSTKGSIYRGFVLAYRAVKGKNCGLCETSGGDACIFNSMAAGNFYDKAPEQCSDEIDGQTFSDPQCYTDIETDTTSSCDMNNEFCNQTCITSTRGDDCFTNFEFQGKQSQGCVAEQSVVEGSQETTKVCPTWRDPSTGVYSNFQPCQDTGGLCPVDYCFSDPCQNGGICTNDENEVKGYRCACPEVWLGHDCTVANECFNDWCNGAENDCSAIDEGDDSFSYQCICNNGKVGDRCDSLGACENDPCQSRGICTLTPATVSGYTCTCDHPYLGENCQFEDQCATTTPCRNDAVCFTKVDGSYLCECVNSWVGDECAQHPDMILECGASSMAVVASVDVINSLTHGEEEIHLLDESCKFEKNDTHYSTEINYQTCGTIISIESAAEVTFFQEIRASRGDGYQSSGFSAALVCQVRASSSVDVNYKKIEHTPVKASYNIDIFPIVLKAFTSSATSGVPTPAATPLELETNEPIYMSISTPVTHRDTQLILQQCWCTKDSDPTTVQKYILYEQKCPVDSTFQITNISTKEIYFEFLSFRFSGEDYNSLVFIHCSAFLCEINEADCTNEAGSCDSPNDGNSRKRREALSDPTIKSRTLTSSFGPIVTGSNLPSSQSSYKIIRDDLNTPRGSGSILTNNFDSALKVYRYYLSENFLYILAIMALIALLLAIITPNLNQPQRILTYARYFMTV